MPEFYFPGDKASRHLEEAPQGFILEFDEESMPVLLMKFDAAKLDSIIKGCAMELLINNPRLTASSLSLVIYDNKKYPCWADGVEDSSKDHVHIDFSPDAINLIGKQQIRIGLYNELRIPIYFAVVPMEFDLPKWEQWISAYYNDPTTLLFSKPSPGLTTQELYKGFSIPIANHDHSKKEKLNIHFKLTEGFNAEKIALKGYNFGDYADNGKHGYNQELSVKHILGTYFEIGKELFIGPKNADGTEFTDFILLLEDTYILFESKYVISTKSNKSTGALNKAVMQLNRADELIRSQKLEMEDPDLAEELISRKFNLKICLHNDSLYLSEEKCKPLIEKFEKRELPMFLSVSVLNQFLAGFHIKNEEYFHVNLKRNLVDRFRSFYSSDESVMIIHNFGFAAPPPNS
jgi:hypothetical protein